MEFAFDREKTVSFSGHRTAELPVGAELEAVRDYLALTLKMLVGNGYKTFINGGCYGFDLLCADAVLRLREAGEDVKLITAVPFKSQAFGWSDEDTALYKRVIDGSDYVKLIENEYSSGVYFRRNRYLVDNCAILIVYCVKISGGTYYTVKYAEGQHVPVINLAEVKPAER